MTKTRLDVIDVVNPTLVRELMHVPGPWVSLSLPTHRSGRDTTQGQIRLNNMISTAQSQLHNSQASEADTQQILQWLKELHDDYHFWQNLADGLVILASPQRQETFRLPQGVVERVEAAEHPRVRALIPYLDGGTTFLLLALSLNQVRLYEGTQTTMTQLELGPIPASYEDAFGHIEEQSHLQHSTRGSGDALFHGHGADSRANQIATERFMRAVAKGLGELFGSPMSLPLVLACVDEHVPAFRSVSSYPLILAEAISGNPESKSAQELHDAAWTLVADAQDSPAVVAWSRAQRDLNQGAALIRPGDVKAAAEQGRVAAVFVNPDCASEAAAEVEDAIRLTLLQGGTVHRLPDQDDPNPTILGLTRY